MPGEKNNNNDNKNNILSGGHTRPSPPGEAHQTIPWGRHTRPSWGWHTRPSPPGEAHQTPLQGRHTRLFPGEGTPDFPGEGTPDSPLLEGAHQTLGEGRGGSRIFRGGGGGGANDGKGEWGVPPPTQQFKLGS